MLKKSTGQVKLTNVLEFVYFSQKIISTTCG